MHPVVEYSRLNFPLNANYNFKHERIRYTDIHVPTCLTYKWV